MEGRKRQKSILETGQLIIHVVYNSFGSLKSQDRLWLCNKKKKSSTVLPSLLYNVQWNLEPQTPRTSQAKGIS